MDRSILIHAWALFKSGEEYYIPYTHWVYLNEIVKYYDRVCLLSPTKVLLTSDNTSNFESLKGFNNIEVYELPYSKGYIDSIKYFRSYFKGYKRLSKEFEAAYTRYPNPFGWLQMLFFPNKKRIIHFVGDPVDTIVNNPTMSRVKKFMYILFFQPEQFMFYLACKNASVFTNGHHLSEKLHKKKIDAVPLISSTLNEKDFYFDERKINEEAPKIIYVGYLRKAKGVETVLKAFALLVAKKPLAKLTIVGQGELWDSLHELSINLGIKNNIFFTGHIDKREELNDLLRNHDIFCFASVSEGSPRVILEAMANGLAIVSTPVGSLPTTFTDKEEILFADFNDEVDFYNKLVTLVNNELYNKIRLNSYEKVKGFTIESFLKKIFSYA